MHWTLPTPTYRHPHARRHPSSTAGGDAYRRRPSPSRWRRSSGQTSRRRRHPFPLVQENRYGDPKPSPFATKAVASCPDNRPSRHQRRQRPRTADLGMLFRAATPQGADQLQGTGGTPTPLRRSTAGEGAVWCGGFKHRGAPPRGHPLPGLLPSLKVLVLGVGYLSGLWGAWQPRGRG